VKKQYISFILAILFGWMLGCNNNPVQAPVQTSNQVSAAGQTIQILELPGAAGLSLAKKSSTSDWVSANLGGYLEIREQFKGVRVFATLSIPRRGLNRDQYISMTLNDQEVKFDFNPDGLQFNKPAMLNFRYTGLDLSSVPVGADLKLYYLNEKKGTLEEMHAESITYDTASGTVTCVNAEIPHFCIYAFGYIKR
jgi:hypothetical protein